MAEHAGFFRGLAKVLRVVGVALVAVGAVLAVFGVGGAVMAAGFLVWGAGDVLDTTVGWAEGRISGRELLVSAGLTLGLSFVGGGAAKLGAKALERMGPRLRQLVADAGQAGLNLPRTGSVAAGAGGRLPQDMNVVRQVAARAGVGLDGVEVRIRKSAPRQGMFGRTDRDGSSTCTPMRSGTRRSWSRRSGTSAPTSGRSRPTATLRRTLWRDAWRTRRRRRRRSGGTTTG